MRSKSPARESDGLVEQALGIAKTGREQFVHACADGRAIRLHHAHKTVSKGSVGISLPLDLSHSVCIRMPGAFQRKGPRASRRPSSFGFGSGAQVITEHEERVLDACPDVRIETHRALVRRERVLQQTAVSASGHPCCKQFRVASAR